MDAHVPGRRTTVLVLTAEPQLERLARSILAPKRSVRAARRLSARESADVVLIDLDAVTPETVRAARDACPGAALIAFTPKRGETDCIAALELGADYLPRPFSPVDFAARVRVAELKLFAATGRPRFYRNGPIAFDLFSGRLSIDGRAVALARSEIVLLAELAGRPGVVFTYERLLDEARLDVFPHGRPSLRSCVMRLRRKIEREPLRPEILLAEIGVGYRLAAPSSQLSPLPRALPDDQEQA
jgi:two-component system, OmpR family, KDP operon response regulator KdpE